MTSARFLLVAAVTLCETAHAQSENATPEAAITAFFHAIERGDGRAAVALVAPEDVPEFRRRELAMITYFFDNRDHLRRMFSDSGGGGMAVGGLSGTSAEFDSVAVAKYAEMPLPVYGVRTVKEFAALAPGELLGRVLTEYARDDAPGRVVGSVIEQDSVGHVLVRRHDPTVDAADLWFVQVARTIRRHGRWYVRLGYVFGGSRVMSVLFETLTAELHKQ
ncbi:MAG TPA: hypothetical protein VJ650_16590 [Gemmatimonadaceae bacterium]|nr:hypothetical protein [Gemmatimonadaceae bacterium]